jgi:hypothetical protein
MVARANNMVNSHQLYNDNQTSFSAKQESSICNAEILDVTFNSSIQRQLIKAAICGNIKPVGQTGIF